MSKSIALLGRFGGKAAGAVPVLEAILESEADKSPHAAAQAAAVNCPNRRHSAYRYWAAAAARALRSLVLSVMWPWIFSDLRRSVA